MKEKRKMEQEKWKKVAEERKQKVKIESLSVTWCKLKNLWMAWSHGLVVRLSGLDIGACLLTQASSRTVRRVQIEDH